MTEHVINSTSHQQCPLDGNNLLNFSISLHYLKTLIVLSPSFWESFCMCVVGVFCAKLIPHLVTKLTVTIFFSLFNINLFHLYLTVMQIFTIQNCIFQKYCKYFTKLSIAMMECAILNACHSPNNTQSNYWWPAHVFLGHRFI